MTREYVLHGKVEQASGLCGWMLRGSPLVGAMAWQSSTMDYQQAGTLLLWFGVQRGGDLCLLESFRGEIQPVSQKLYVGFEGSRGRHAYATINVHDGVFLSGTVVLTGRGMDGLLYRRMEASFTAKRSRDKDS